MDKYRVIGAGGTGSHLLPQLITYLDAFYSNRDFWQVHVIDGDVIEPKNLVRQLFSPTQINLNKAKAIASRFRKTYKNVYAIPEYLSRANIAKIIEEGSIVLICVDNFPVRGLIEEHCKSLSDVVVINGGNEFDTGTCQIWIRQEGQNITPPISFLHPEILAGGNDRSEMSCEQIASLPGGEQLIVTNMASAMYMLAALINFHQRQIPWTELEFSLSNPTNGTTASDLRIMRGWQ